MLWQFMDYFLGVFALNSSKILSIIDLALLFFRWKQYIKKNKSGNCDSKQIPFEIHD